MLEQFRSYISENSLCLPADTILLAVSGGIDSVVLLDLFTRSGFTCAVAHCNFNLRGDESSGDAAFVHQLADSYNVPYFSRSFETLEYAEINKVSIQMAARELRYEWFEEVRNENDYDYIATAHNRNDILETFFINLLRGTGIHGLTGIKSRNGLVIRPMLFASRKMISNYAQQHSLNWREDSTNATLKYSRNKIRHELIPLLEKMNNRFDETMMENIQRLGETEEIFNEAVDARKEELLVREHNLTTIDINSLKNLSPLKTWLYELLKDFNFTSAVVDDIIASLDSPPGKKFFSTTHRVVKDRYRLVIDSLKDVPARKYYIEDPYRQVSEPLNLEMDVLPGPISEFLHDRSVAYFDLDLLDFPLVIRRREPGDYFHPFGMSGIKKLSDFFVDLKLSIPEKDNIWLLTCGGKIVWVIGQRPDNRFRVTELTKRILKISLLQA